MNTAVLTGRQVSQAMKVFIVSQAGKVADVTLQSSCHAEDESVIKVSKTFIYYQLRRDRKSGKAVKREKRLPGSGWYTEEFYNT